MSRLLIPLGLTATALAVALVGGCAADPDTPTPTGGAGTAATRTVTTVFGEEEIPAKPQRVAAISYDTPWQLQSLNVVQVATMDYSQYADSFTADQLDFISGAASIGTYSELSLEALTKAQPDLIVGTEFEIDEPTYKQLREIAPTVIVGGSYRGDWREDTRQVAEALGAQDEWAADKAAFEKSRDEIKTTYGPTIAQHTWIAFTLGGEGEFSVLLPTGATGDLLANELAVPFGPGAQLEDVEGRGFVGLSLEQLPAAFKEVTAAITFSNVNGVIYPAIQEIMDNPLFKQLDMAKSGQIYPLMSSVTDYNTATGWINEFATKALAPLAQA